MNDLIKNEISKLSLKMKIEMEIEFSKKVLKLINKNIGDIVLCTFYGSSISNRKSYTNSYDRAGKIIVNKDGVICVESEDVIPQTYHTSNNRSGRDYRGWWVSKPKITQSNLIRIL